MNFGVRQPYLHPLLGDGFRNPISQEPLYKWNGKLKNNVVKKLYRKPKGDVTIRGRKQTVGPSYCAQYGKGVSKYGG